MKHHWAVIYYDGVEYFPTRTEAFVFAKQAVDDAREGNEWQDWATDVRVAEIHAQAESRQVDDETSEVVLCG